MNKYLAECIGTFALVFCGTGAIIVDQQTNGALGLIGISMTFGIMVTAMIYVFGSISGTHINPAVTIGLAVGRQMPKKDVFFYLVFQILGAFAATGLLTLLFPENLSLGATMPSGSVLQSFVIEFVLTFFLMLTILGVTSKKETSAFSGIVTGAVVVAIILFSGPISGGSFNPARSIAPAIVSGNVTMLWIYIFAPILGAVLAMICWRILSTEK